MGFLDQYVKRYVVCDKCGGACVPEGFGGDQVILKCLSKSHQHVRFPLEIFESIVEGLREKELSNDEG